MARIGYCQTLSSQTSHCFDLAGTSVSW